jgi:hypothetical protein
MKNCQFKSSIEVINYSLKILQNIQRILIESLIKKTVIT